MKFHNKQMIKYIVYNHQDHNEQQLHKLTHIPASFILY